MYGEYNEHETQFQVRLPYGLQSYNSLSTPLPPLLLPQPPYMDNGMGYHSSYPYGDTTPPTSTSRLPSENGTDHSGRHDYQYRPVLQQMLDEFYLGDELLKKDNKKFSIRLGRSKS